MSNPLPTNSDSTALGPLHATVIWLENLLLGSLGSTIAIIAIAFVGLTLLSGHLRVRDGFRTVVGAFILFGAPLIAAGIDNVARQVGGSSQIEIPQMLNPPAVPISPPKAAKDPYAGVAIDFNE